jgi:hypothetical protein
MAHRYHGVEQIITDFLFHFILDPRKSVLFCVISVQNLLMRYLGLTNHSVYNASYQS